MFVLDTLTKIIFCQVNKPMLKNLMKVMKPTNCFSINVIFNFNSKRADVWNKIDYHKHSDNRKLKSQKNKNNIRQCSEEPL